MFTALRRPGFAGGPLPVKNVVVLDWMLAESLLILGIIPAGMANPDGFRQTYTAINLPAFVKDVGLIYQPNLEMLNILRPQVIIITPEHASILPLLEQIAPTLTVGEPITPTENSFKRAGDALLQLAGAFGRLPRAQTTLSSAENTIASARQRIAALPYLENRAAYIVQFIDNAFIRVFGSATLFGEMLNRLGLRNAYQQRTNSAGLATTGYEILCDHPEALFIYFTPLSAPARTMIDNSPVWRALPFREAGHSIPLTAPPLNGGVVSAASFATALADGLIATESGAHHAPAHRGQPPALSPDNGSVK